VKRDHAANEAINPPLHWCLREGGQKVERAPFPFSLQAAMQNALIKISNVLEGIIS